MLCDIRRSCGLILSHHKYYCMLLGVLVLVICLNLIYQIILVCVWNVTS